MSLTPHTLMLETESPDHGLTCQVHVRVPYLDGLKVGHHTNGSNNHLSTKISAGLEVNQLLLTSSKRAGLERHEKPLTSLRKAASNVAATSDRPHNRATEKLERKMLQTTRRLILAGALALAVTPALAEDPVYTSIFSNVAVSGYDAVAYFTEGKPVEGSGNFVADYDGATWQFASAANRDAFLDNPERFAPQYGGYCAWAVSQGYTASTDPEAWKIVDDKLYLNYSKSVQATWEQDIPGNIEKGDANWPSVLN